MSEGQKSNNVMNIEDKIKIGQLISLEWKLGVAIKSKDSPELNTPFVTIFMKTADSNNIKSSHCFELNLQEFKNFAKSLRDCYKLIQSS